MRAGVESTEPAPASDKPLGDGIEMMSDRTECPNEGAEPITCKREQTTLPFTVTARCTGCIISCTTRCTTQFPPNGRSNAHSCGGGQLSNICVSPGLGYFIFLLLSDRLTTGTCNRLHPCRLRNSHGEQTRQISPNIETHTARRTHRPPQQIPTLS